VENSGEGVDNSSTASRGKAVENPRPPPMISTIFPHNSRAPEYEMRNPSMIVIGFLMRKTRYLIHSTSPDHDIKVENLKPHYDDELLK
jgi:hypothetical protein